MKIKTVFGYRRNCSFPSSNLNTCEVTTHISAAKLYIFVVEQLEQRFSANCCKISTFLQGTFQKQPDDNNETVFVDGYQEPVVYEQV